jgi:spermidine synthase
MEKFLNMEKGKWITESGNIPFDETQTRTCLKINKKLYSGKSSFQKIEVYDTVSFGRVLMLDDIYQTSEKDEFIYHEMLCQLPMIYHSKPKKVLIVGGGDGGSLKEVLKHPVEKVWMVEIDEKVVDVSKKYLPSISQKAFDDKRAEVIIDDGIKFVKEHENFFDVIILDLSEPWGPAEKVVSLDFYKSVRRALKKDGVVSVQGENFFYQPSLVALIYQRVKKAFPSTIIHHAPVLLYGIGEMSVVVASNDDLSKVSLNDVEKKFKRLKLKTKYYNPKIHFASAVLPEHWKKRLKIK